jgi:GDP-L-fucose synthase
VATAFELAGRRVFVAGDRGMVGQALLRRLAREDCTVLTAPRALDLRDQAATHTWFRENQPDVAVIAAGKVGGIMANAAAPATFLYDNLLIATNTIEAARQACVAKLLYLGSSCIFPRDAAQPMREDALLTGPLEPTNEGYALAKIAGVRLCAFYRREHGCDFISAMPTNLYGPGDNYDPTGSHVLPALIRKAHEAKVDGAPVMTVWGTGRALREFLHVDDLADACVFLVRNYSGEAHVNVGSGEEHSIGDLARLVAEVVGFAGRIAFDTTKPDGAPRKLLNCTVLGTLGWRAGKPLRQGIEHAYADYLARIL